MSRKLEPKRSARFIDHWAWLGFVPAALAGIAALYALSSGSDLVRQDARLDEDEPWESQTFTLNPDAPGAVRLDARVTLEGPNRWAAVGLSVLDAKGEPVAELVKEAWQEEGVWAEEGETGTWEESDLDAVFDFRGLEGEPLTVQATLIEGGLAGDLDTASSQAPPVALRLTVREGVLDDRWMLLGFGLALTFALLGWYIGGHSGRPVIVEQMSDHKVIGRAECGGPGKLVRARLVARADETCPLKVVVRLSVRDANGALVYEERRQRDVSQIKSDGDVEGARLSCEWYFLLRTRQSYGFTATVDPDGPLESTRLVVHDGAMTRAPVDVLTPDGAAIEEEEDA